MISNQALKLPDSAWSTSSPALLHMTDQLTYVTFLFLKFSVVKITPSYCYKVRKHTFLGALRIQIEIYGEQHPPCSKAFHNKT